MCKTLEPSDFPRVFPSTEICRGVGDFSTGASKGGFSTGTFSFSTTVCGKNQRLELILVLISLTRSAKEESFFICFSTCLMEYKTVE